MSRNSDFASLLAAIARFQLPGYTQSKALLYWFLYNIYRLDEIQARDTICDAVNDKGIDALWTDDDTQEIFLFQSYFTDKIHKTLGDTKLKEFVASAKWFSNPRNVKKLLRSSANPELKSLVRRCEIVEKLRQHYTLKLVFVTTRSLDTNAKEYLENIEGGDIEIDVWHQSRLTTHHKTVTRSTRVPGTFQFDKCDSGISHSIGSIKLHATYVRASDIARMRGIEDRTLFALNVREGLGRTRVNKELEAAIRDTDNHDHFAIFHNGLTVICEQLVVDDAASKIEIENFSIANGCQSAIAFHDNAGCLTNDLTVFVRFIEVGTNDDLAQDITYANNNQNGINLRDLKSNDRIQLHLQKEFRRLFGHKLQLAIKAGEKEYADEILKNDRAGQLLMSLYLNEPYNAHQKYRLFGDDYERVFGRGATATRIYLARLLYSTIETLLPKIKDPLIAEYQLTKFILLGITGQILRQDAIGKRLLEKPETYLPKHRRAVRKAYRVLAAQAITDFNYYVQQQQHDGEFFDYKSEFKSPDRYRNLSTEMVHNYERALIRHPEDAFEQLFKA